MELIIIRHGRPERIENAVGPADPPLTDVGHRQSSELGTWLQAERIDRLYVSPMVRARETARPVEEILGMEAAVVNGVREFDDHAAEYIPMEELKEDKEAWKAMLEEMSGETRDEFRTEVLTSMAEIVGTNRGKRVAVVCHGGVINAYASDVLGLNGEMFFNPHYTSINRFMCASSGERSVVSLNDIGHLRAHPDLVLYS